MGYKLRLNITSYLKGHIAELYVLCFLFLKGYRLIQKRYRSPVGEIDLVMRQGNKLIAIEVKYRQTYRHGVESISAKQQHRICRTIDFFLKQHAYRRFDAIRFDVCIVYQGWHIKHLQNIT